MFNRKAEIIKILEESTTIENFIDKVISNNLSIGIKN